MTSDNHKNNAQYFLGVDLGSAFTKFTVCDSDRKIVHRDKIKTLNIRSQSLRHAVDSLYAKYSVRSCCATGYGRSKFEPADLIKTEINCAAEAFYEIRPGAKCIIDIGGEDIKIIHCDDSGKVDSFYLNSKCAAGTGAFLTEIAERAELDLSQLSALAENSDSEREINSFCTVFAKTEIMGWLFDDVPPEDIARGIYAAIINRVCSLRIDPTGPIFLIGGVAAHHPFFTELLGKSLARKITVPEKSEYIVAYGAALMAKKFSKNQKGVQ